MDPSRKLPNSSEAPGRPGADQPGTIGATASAPELPRHTRVRCSAGLEVKMLHWRRCSGLGRLNAECRLLPASTPSRQARELLKRSGRTQEISA